MDAIHRASEGSVPPLPVVRNHLSLALVVESIVLEWQGQTGLDFWGYANPWCFQMDSAIVLCSEGASALGGSVFVLGNLLLFCSPRNSRLLLDVATDVEYHCAAVASILRFQHLSAKSRPSA